MATRRNVRRLPGGEGRSQSGGKKIKSTCLQFKFKFGLLLRCHFSDLPFTSVAYEKILILNNYFDIEKFELNFIIFLSWACVIFPDLPTGIYPCHAKIFKPQDGRLKDRSNKLSQTRNRNTNILVKLWIGLSFPGNILSTHFFVRFDACRMNIVSNEEAIFYI